MKLFFDTSILVDVERGRNNAETLLATAQDQKHDLWISTVTVSEIFAGLYLRKDADRREALVREILGQFLWKDLDGEVAVRVGQIHAFLLSHGERIEYQDTVIAASCLLEEADYLVTENLAHFRAIPGLERRAVGIKEAARLLAKKM